MHLNYSQVLLSFQTLKQMTKSDVFFFLSDDYSLIRPVRFQ
jgi:hypothetical protein